MVCKAVWLRVALNGENVSVDFSLLIAAFDKVSLYSALNVVSRTVASGMCLGMANIERIDWVWKTLSFCQWVRLIVR